MISLLHQPSVGAGLVPPCWGRSTYAWLQPGGPDKYKKYLLRKNFNLERMIPIPHLNSLGKKIDLSFMKKMTKMSKSKYKNLTSLFILIFILPLPPPTGNLNINI